MALDQTAGPSSLEEALAAAGLTDRYRNALPPDDLEPGLTFVEIAAFVQSLEVVYGSLGGRGIALRVGNAFFNEGLQGYDVLRGVLAPEFANLPTTSQAHISLMGLAAVFSQISSQQSTLEDHVQALHFIVDPSPVAWGRTSSKPVCHLLVGVLQATLRWATRGYEFSVYETACRAAGAKACTFQINKQPIGRV